MVGVVNLDEEKKKKRPISGLPSNIQAQQDALAVRSLPAGNAEKQITPSDFSSDMRSLSAQKVKPMTPEQKKELELAEAVLKAPKGKGVDAQTGELKPAMDISNSPFGKAMSAKFGISDEQQILLDQQREQEAMVLRQEKLAPLLDQVGSIETPKPNIKVAGLGEAINDIVPAVGITTGAGAVGGLGAAALGATGATLGAVAAPIAAAGIALAANKVISEVKDERAKQVTAEGMGRKLTNLQKVIKATANGSDPIASQQIYNQIIGDIYQSEANLKLLDEASWTNAKAELRNIEDFKRVKPILDDAMRNAMIQNQNFNYEILDEVVDEQA